MNTSPHESNGNGNGKGNGKAAAAATPSTKQAPTKKQTIQGPLLTLVGLCLFLVGNFAYDAWIHSAINASSGSLATLHPSSDNLARTASSKPMESTCLIKEPTYKEVEGFCSSFPADKTASYLWNQNMELILDVTVNESMDNSADKEWMHDILRTVLRPVRLRDGLRSLPQASSWGRVVERLHDKLQHPNTTTVPPVSVIVLGGSTVQGVGSCVLPSSMGKSTGNVPKESLDCAWPVRLQTLLDRFVGQGVVQVTVVAIPTATTELFTAMIQDGRVLQTQQGDSGDGPNGPTQIQMRQLQSADLILHAAGSQDNYKLGRDHPTMMDVQYQEHQRRVQQDFIRAALQSQPCRNADNKHAGQPAVVYLDDYLQGQGHETIVADTITARVIHQLTDYYTAVGLVSYASVVNRLVMADTANSVFGGSLNYGKVAHVGVMWTLVFAALEFTVDYCSHVSAKSQETLVGNEDPFISEDVLRRVSTVPPPYLNGNTSLVTVSDQWIQEEKRMLDRRHVVCGKGKNVTVLPPSCLLAVTSISNGGAVPKKKATSLQDYFKPATHKKSIGWKVLETGTLRATQAGASLKLEMVVPEHQSISHVQVFVVREDVNVRTKSTAAAAAAAALLQVKVILPGSDHEKLVEVDATHNSAVRVALPVKIEVQPPAAAGTLVQLELRLIQGETVDIEGVFVC